MAKLYNRVKVATATTGTGTVTLGAASSNAFMTFAEAGVANADVVSYCIEEGTDFEYGIGTYTSSGTTLSRDTVTKSKISGTAGTTKMTLAGTATVRIVARSEDLISVSETKTANTVFAGPSSGAAAAPAFRAIVAADLPTTGLVSVGYYTSSNASLAIPSGATKARVRMLGGGGGISNANGASAGNGAYLEKYLSGLTAGNTLNLTIGAGGNTSGSNGGNTSLASGTQSITTLTAGGGGGSSGGLNAAGGTATNGDLNVSGSPGMAFDISATITGVSLPTQFGPGISIGAGPNYGVGAAGNSGSGKAGGQGLAIIEWFA